MSGKKTSWQTKAAKISTYTVARFRT